MLSDTWCYSFEPNTKRYDVLRVSRPISKRQAIFILKKRLQISKIYSIFSCNQDMGDFAND